MYKLYRPGETVPNSDIQAMAREINQGNVVRFMANVSNGVLPTETAASLLRDNDRESMLSRVTRALLK